MANRALSVLSISCDESLLRTREWILKAAGFDVTSALGFAQATAHCNNNGFDLVIVGHSLPRSDKATLVREIRSHNHSRILGLCRHGEEPVPGMDHSVDPFDVKALVEAVGTVLGKSGDSTR